MWRGCKKNDFFMFNALVSPHGVKNEVYFIVARLFRLMAQRTT